MKNYRESIEAAVCNNLSHESSELMDYPRDLYEASHEHADNHENVIYTAKAHENYRNAYGEALAYAEERFEELGGVPEGGVNGASVYDSCAILLSYHLEEFRFQELVRNELEALQNELEELEDEINAEIEEREENEEEPCEELAECSDSIRLKLDTIREILNQ